jgi:hypothetical protein
MRFFSDGIRKPNFIHEVNRIHAYSQSPLGLSYEERHVCLNVIDARSTDALLLRGRGVLALDVERWLDVRCLLAVIRSHLVIS